MKNMQPIRANPNRIPMPYSVSTLLTRNLQEVFGEDDPARRRAAIDELDTEDGVFYDPARASTYDTSGSGASIQILTA
jgi:hypothetical protein